MSEGRLPGCLKVEMLCDFKIVFDHEFCVSVMRITLHNSARSLLEKMAMERTTPHNQVPDALKVQAA